VLTRRGMWREGIDQLRRAVELEPGRAAGWYYLGEALNHMDDLNGALAAYERAVEIQPANPKALYGIGKILDRLNRPDEATAMYRRSREMTGR
jgi:cytochrome c-type biogenesis protein CcmH/NrfG